MKGPGFVGTNNEKARISNPEGCSRNSKDSEIHGGRHGSKKLNPNGCVGLTGAAEEGRA